MSRDVPNQILIIFLNVAVFDGFVGPKTIAQRSNRRDRETRENIIKDFLSYLFLGHIILRFKLNYHKEAWFLNVWTEIQTSLVSLILLAFFISSKNKQRDQSNLYAFQTQN